jgi:hypothetical protein
MNEGIYQLSEGMGAMLTPPETVTLDIGVTVEHMSHLYQISLSFVIGHRMCHRRLPTTDFQ